MIYLDLQLINVNNSITLINDSKNILNCNDMTKKYNLFLSEKDSFEIIQCNSKSLANNNRIQFDEIIAPKLIYSFCDSPYINQQNYKQTMEDLIDIFYYYKNETMDLVSDDELIEYMAKAFNNSCEGSLELLASRELHTFTCEILSNKGDKINESFK